MLIFENSIKSDATRKTYLYHLSKFMSFCKIKDYDELATLPQQTLQIMMEDYVMHLKKTMSPNGINLPIAAVKAFLDCNDVELRWSKIKRLKPARVKKTGGEAWLTDEINKMLSFTTELRTKTLVHFIASSGIRIGALEDIKMKHIKQIDDCKSVLVYDGSTEEYVTFLTPEASLMFDDYLQKRESDGERLTPESPAFRSSYQLGFAKVKPSNTNALKEIIRILILKSGLRINQIKIGKRYNKQAGHGFRKRFNTILKTTHDMNISLAEKMMGHSVTVALDNVYLDPTIEQLFQEFKKAIPELTIDDSQRLKFKNEKLEKEKSELEIPRAEIEEMEKKMKDLQEKSTEAQKMMATMMLTMNEHKKEFLPKEMFDRDLPIDQNFKKSEGMIGIEATENYMKIKDDKLSKLVMVKIKDGKLWCSYDKSDICKHIEYAILKNIGFMLNLIKQGIKMPGEELMKKRLEEIVNQSNE